MCIRDSLGGHPGNGPHHLPGAGLRQVPLQFQHIVGEALFVGGVQVAAQRHRGVAIGARCPAQAQVDAAGVQRGQRTELFGHHQRGVVGQHDAAGAHADALRAARDVADQHRSGRTRHTVHVVMLGHPVAAITPGVGVAGQVQRVLQRQRRVAPFDDGREIQDGQGDHSGRGRGWPLVSMAT